MSFHNFAHWEDHLASARNGHDRPLSSNTRVRWVRKDHGDIPSPYDCIAIRLHNTDIITMYRSGRITLAHGGWRTVTTKQRLNQYAPGRIYGWEIPFEDDPNDPEPEHLEREILKPFHAPDPGPEPVDDGVGCRVGEVEVYEEQALDIDFWPDTHMRNLPGGYPTKLDIKYADGSGGPKHVTVRTNMVREEYIGANTGYWEHDEIRRRGHRAKVCAHCEAFKELHDQWDRAMNGTHWGRGSGKGFRQMTEHLETFGTREAWQEAYIEEFREVRENQRECKEWHARNVVPFYNGIEVDSFGRVPLKRKREHLKQLRRTQREERRSKREQDERARVLAKREQERAHRREVMGMVAQAMAESTFFEAENGRAAWQAIKDKHHGKETRT